jgi:hypothetical protein
MRKFLHDSLVRQFHHVASLALLSPTIECTLPLPHDETSPGTRADVVMPSPDGNGQLWVIDFAVTHIARANAPAHLAAAAAAPGGAAALAASRRRGTERLCHWVTVEFFSPSCQQKKFVFWCCR